METFLNWRHYWHLRPDNDLWYESILNITSKSQEQLLVNSDNQKHLSTPPERCLQGAWMKERSFLCEIWTPRPGKVSQIQGILRIQKQFNRGWTPKKGRVLIPKLFSISHHFFLIRPLSFISGTERKGKKTNLQARNSWKVVELVQILLGTCICFFCLFVEILTCSGVNSVTEWCFGIEEKF